LPNWKGVIIAGIIASLFNSFTGAFLKGELIASDQVYQVIIRFIVGDIAGLIFCMILLVFIFALWISLPHQHIKVVILVFCWHII
jgi:hypothetical protein